MTDLDIPEEAELAVAPAPAVVVVVTVVGAAGAAVKETVMTQRIKIRNAILIVLRGAITDLAFAWPL